VSTILQSKNFVLKLVNNFWLNSIVIMVSEEEKSTSSAFDTEMTDDKAKGGYTTRHGSHLTKTTQGVAESEDIEATKT